MREGTDRMIDRLARDAAPVKPLRSPWLRAGAFLISVVVAMAGLAAFSGHVSDTIAHMVSMPFAAELIGAVIAGLSAVVSAVMLSVPGRSATWIYLPLPGLVLWLIGGGLECYRQVAESGYAPTSLFASRDCFVFIMSIGLPTAVAAYFFLRRNLSIGVARVLALAGMGVALLAAALLQFMHAHGTNPVDFGTHFVAVALITLAGMFAARIEFGRR